MIVPTIYVAAPKPGDCPSNLRFLPQAYSFTTVGLAYHSDYIGEFLSNRTYIDDRKKYALLYDLAGDHSINRVTRQTSPNYMVIYYDDP